MNQRAPHRKDPESKDKQVKVIIVSHKFSSKGTKYPSGSEFECPERQAARLVKHGVAVRKIEAAAEAPADEKSKDASKK